MNEHTLPSGSESLALPTDLVGDEISISPSELRSLGDRFQKFHLEYRFAMQEVETKLDILREEFLHMHEYHPIEHVSSRVKSIDSLLAKVERRGISPDIDSIRREVRDIAGVRVTCAFRRDVYKLFDLLTQQDDVTVLEVEDYIVDPKPNGYKSLHAIISVPVFLSSGRVDVPVEVQFRTIAMDFWATLDHDMQYKKQVEDSEAIMRELRECADVIHQTDEKMMRLRERIHRIDPE